MKTTAKEKARHNAFVKHAYASFVRTMVALEPSLKATEHDLGGTHPTVASARTLVAEVKALRVPKAK